MCIGVPMRVRELQPGYALCEHNGLMERVDISLVGEPSVGSWLLVFLGAAREVISEQRALQVQQALSALQGIQDGSVTDGSQLDVLFADLVEQKPQLPPHLQALVDNNNEK